MNDESDTASTLPGHVLVVDDEAKNRTLLADFLQVQGYRVSTAENGEVALDKAAREFPDVILLDVMMPGLDGFAVCRRLKADQATAPIPVLIVTVLQDREDRLTGIEAGATDFLSKPLDFQETLLRVKNAVATKRLYDQVLSSYVRLVNLESLRDNLTHMIVHDMRSPLSGILGNLQLLQMRLKDKLNEKERRWLDNTFIQSSALMHMINSVLDVSKLENSKMTIHPSECTLEALAREAVVSLGPVATRYHMEVTGAATVYCDAGLIGRVLANLIGNAVKYSPEGSEVKVVLEERDGHCKVMVVDHGHGIPPEYREKIFEKFGQVEGRQRAQYSTGLGLTFCKLAVELHGGTIGVESEAGKGSTFWFVLPLKPREFQRKEKLS